MEETTIIQIRRETHKILSRMKKELRYATYDDVINLLLSKSKNKEMKDVS